MLARRDVLVGIAGLVAMGVLPMPRRKPHRRRRSAQAGIASGRGDGWVSSLTIYMEAQEPPPPPPGGTYPIDRTSLTAPAVNGDARPGYLATITDSTWGTNIKRITNTAGWRNNYSVHQAWNLDGTRIMLPGYGHRILDGNTYQDLGAMPSGTEYPNWSNLHADTAYGVSAWDNILRRYSVSANAYYPHHTFAGYTSLDWGGYSGNLSDNDRVVLIGDASGSYSIIVYDCENDVVISTLAVGGTSPGGCMISRSGDYAVVSYATNGTGTFEGTKLYNASNMLFRRHMDDGGPHQDCGRDASGADIWAWCNNNAGGIWTHRMSDGATMRVTGPDDIFGIGHVSCAAYDRPGWLYASCNNRTLTSLPGFGQIIAAATDGQMDQFEVFAFSHQSSDDYDGTPLASVNRTGDRVIWGSQWGYAEVYCYVAGMGV